MSNKLPETLQAVVAELGKGGDDTALYAFTRTDMEETSWNRLNEKVEAVASWLVAHGTDTGTRIVLSGRSTPEWIAAALAILRAGAQVVPIDAQIEGESLKHVLRDSNARWAFADTDRAPQLKQAAEGTNLSMILLQPSDGKEDPYIGNLAADQEISFPNAAPDDVATLFYTSGTTGPPKGVPLTHRNLLSSVSAALATGLVVTGDRLLLPLPAHHVYPFVTGILSPLAVRVPIVLPQAITGPQLVRAMHDGRVTIVLGVPRLYRALYEGIISSATLSGRAARIFFRAAISLSGLLRHIGVRAGKRLLRPVHQRFGPDIRVLASGGAALDPDLAWKLERIGWRVVIGYGLTETSPLLTFNTQGPPKLASVGQAVENIELRIESEGESSDGRACPAPGEVLARGPNVFSGYLNLPEETAKKFDDEGWFRTGDLGYFDDEKFLYLAGRASTMIVTQGGENVQPEQVEAVCESHHLIAEAGVLEKGGRIVAVMVPDMDAAERKKIKPEQAVGNAVTAINEGLPSYQRIMDYVVSRDSLARTRLGKIRRHLLEDHYDSLTKKSLGKKYAGGEPARIGEMSERDRALLDDPNARAAWDWLCERYAKRRLTPDCQPGADLGIDSLEWLNLSMELRQRLGVELTEKDIGEISTIRDLLQCIAEARKSGEKHGGEPVPWDKPDTIISTEQKKWLRPHSTYERSLATLFYGLNRFLMRILFRLRVEGLEHVPASTPLIFAPNHMSYLDPLALGAALPRDIFRRTRWAGWIGAAFKNRLTRTVSRLAGAVPVDPDRAAASSLALGAVILQSDSNLVWFPEGRRSPTGRLQPFRPGIGMLLDHHDTPVIPVFISGSERALPVGARMIRPHRIVVRFGHPVRAKDLRSGNRGSSEPLDIASKLRDRVAELGGVKSS